MNKTIAIVEVEFVFTDTKALKYRVRPTFVDYFAGLLQTHHLNKCSFFIYHHGDDKNDLLNIINGSSVKYISFKDITYTVDEADVKKITYHIISLDAIKG